MMIEEVYNRNLYNVVLNDVLRRVKMGATVAAASEEIRKTHTKTLNMTDTYFNEENSMFFDNRKLRLSDDALDKILERVAVDVPTDSAQVPQQTYVIPSEFKSSEDNVIILSK